MGPNPIFTSELVTAWYRTPETLLGSTKCTRGCDIWAVGCILGEMLSGKPIFPGTSTMNQLERIVEVIGRPLSSEIDSMNILNTANILNSVPQPSNPRSLAHMCPNASTEALDCMRALLRFNPIDRISAENALEHPYVKQFHALEEEPVCSHKVNVSTLGSGGIRMSLQKLREKFFYDIGVIDGQILE